MRAIIRGKDISCSLLLPECHKVGFKIFLKEENTFYIKKDNQHNKLVPYGNVVKKMTSIPWFKGS